MKIAVYERSTTRDIVWPNRSFYDRIVHVTSLCNLKGLRSGATLEMFVFDQVDVSDIIQNLATGFDEVAVFDVSDFHLYKR